MEIVNTAHTSIVVLVPVVLVPGMGDDIQAIKKGNWIPSLMT